MTPSPSPYFTSITGTDRFGKVTTVNPGAFHEYATEATAKAALAAVTAQVPEGGPYTLIDINGNTVGVAWDAPMYGIQASNGAIFNAGLVYQSISQGGYNAMLTFGQIRQTVIG